MEKISGFEEALKTTGFGKFNVFLILISGGCLFTVNADAYSISYLLPSAQCDLNLTTFDKGTLTSVSFIGIICSSHLWGFLADTRGRKFVIVLTLFCSFLCIFISSFVVNFWIFAVLRFFSGFFMAGASTAVYPYLGEFHSDKHRTMSISCASLFVSIAILALPGLAWLVIPQKWSVDIFSILIYKPWRFFYILCLLPGVLLAGVLLIFPESPKFLLTRGKHLEALKVLKMIYALNSGKPRNEFPITALYEEKFEEREDEKFFLKSMWDQTVPLFQVPHVFQTFIICSLQFGLFAISSGLLLWYPEIVNKMAEHSKNYPNVSITVCEAISKIKIINDSQNVQCSDGLDVSVFQQNLIIGVAYIIGTIIIILFINSLGKRTLLIIFLLISSGTAIALCFITNRFMVNYLFVGLLTLSGISVFIANAAVVDMFPTHLRAMAVCISLMCGRIGSVLASSIIGVLLEMNCIVAFIIFSIVLLGCAVISWWIPNHSKTKL